MINLDLEEKKNLSKMFDLVDHFLLKSHIYCNVYVIPPGFLIFAGYLWLNSSRCSHVSCECINAIFTLAAILLSHSKLKLKKKHSEASKTYAKFITVLLFLCLEARQLHTYSSCTHQICLHPIDSHYWSTIDGPSFFSITIYLLAPFFYHKLAPPALCGQ